MTRDFVEMLSVLAGANVEFMVVGAHALAAHGQPRATGDLDVWVRPSAENAERVLHALKRFGAPLLDLTLDDLARAGTVFQIGVPPSRIDILNDISGLTFDEAWPRRATLKIEGVPVAVIGREDFILNKRAAGRPKDLADIALLDEAEGR